jgi:hypothetical protein
MVPSEQHAVPQGASLRAKLQSIVVKELRAEQDSEAMPPRKHTLPLGQHMVPQGISLWPRLQAGAVTVGVEKVDPGTVTIVPNLSLRFLAGRLNVRDLRESTNTARFGVVFQVSSPAHSLTRLTALALRAARARVHVGC